jgi:hypothetical protein
MRRLLGLAAGALLLASCRVDTTVDMVVDADGSGTITVVTTADAGVVDEVPTLVEDLVLDDVAAAGWTIDGPNETADGGLTIALSHDFADAQGATNLLQSLGPPFNQIEFTRRTSGDVTTNQLTGLLGLTDGFASFADEELVAAIGSAPFSEQIEASGATPPDSMSVTVRANLPGAVVEESTNATSVDGDVLVWTVPLDGSVLELRAETRQEPSAGGAWARPLATVALVALIAWVAFMTAFIGYVVIARWRRSRRHRRRPTPRRA